MSAGLLGTSFAFPGLGTGITSSSACSGFSGTQDNGSDIVDFGGGIGFPDFLRDMTRRNPLASLIALVVIVLAIVWMLTDSSSSRRRRRRRKGRK